MKYVIIRFYKNTNKDSQIIRKNLTLGEAQKHCNDPKTSTPEYFDGYEEQSRINPDRLRSTKE